MKQEIIYWSSYQTLNFIDFIGELIEKGYWIDHIIENVSINPNDGRAYIIVHKLPKQ